MGPTDSNKRLFLHLILLKHFFTAEGDLFCNVSKDTSQDDKPAWCLPFKYDSRKPPFLSLVELEDTPRKMNLNFTFSVQEVSEVKDRDQTLKIPMYFTVSWEDERLDVNENHKSWEENTTGPLGEITEDVQTINSLWTPSLEIYGLEEFSTNKVLGEMAGLRITKGKLIKYDIKTTITISCQMDFTEYPFDKHICYFQVGSYFFDKDAVTCSSEFIDPTINKENQTSLNTRKLQHYITYRELSEGKRTVSLRTGTYAACGFEIHLDRKQEPLIWQVYLPCCLFVTVSWISFIIDPKVVPGRMSLLVILLLVIINVFNNVKSTSPSTGSRFLNAVETFIITCIFSIFSAIIEYAIVYSIITLRTGDTAEGQARVYQITDPPIGYDLKGRLWVLIRKPRILDVLSIIVFSSTFILFNLNYWVFTPYE